MIYRIRKIDFFPAFLRIKNTKDLRLWYNPAFKFDNAEFTKVLFHSHQPDKLGLSVIKFIKRRSIFSLNVDNKKVIIKSFPLLKLNEKIRYKKYAISELLNNQKSHNTGINTPENIGYFEIRRKGFVDNCGVIMAFLSGYASLCDLYMKSKRSLFIAIPIIIQLYNQCINHIDVSLNNIYYNCDQKKYAIIDWQYCSFTTPCNELQLIVHAAYLLKNAGIEPENELWHSWLKQLHSESAVYMKYEYFSGHVFYLQHKKMLIKDRLALNSKRLGIQLK